MSKYDVKENNVNQNFVVSILKSNLSKDDLILIINLYSYFIGNINHNYKYNSTYLSSYVDKFFSFQEKVKDKNKYFKYYVNKILELRGTFQNEFTIIMDKFWLFETKIESRRASNSNIKNDVTCTGVINIDYVLNDEIYLECKYMINNAPAYLYKTIELTKIVNNEKTAYTLAEIKLQINKFIAEITYSLNLMEDKNV